jgi:hypothetical protein
MTGINLAELSQNDVGFNLSHVREPEGVRRCATGAFGASAAASSELKFAVLSGAEHRMLQELRAVGPLQALARSCVTMRDREASRLAVELDDQPGDATPRVRCLGVRPRLLRDGSLQLEVLPCVDETGRPVEESGESLQAIGEVVLRPGETAVLGGLIEESRIVARSGPRGSTAARKANRSTVERTEWLFLVSPRLPNQPELSRHSRRAKTPRTTAGR